MAVNNFGSRARLRDDREQIARLGAVRCVSSWCEFSGNAAPRVGHTRQSAYILGRTGPQPYAL